MVAATKSGSREATRQAVTYLADTLKLNTESVVGGAKKQPNLGILSGTGEEGNLILLKVTVK